MGRLVSAALYSGPLQTLDNLMKTGRVLGSPDRWDGVDPFKRAAKRISQIDPYGVQSHVLTLMMGLPKGDKRTERLGAILDDYKARLLEIGGAVPAGDVSWEKYSWGCCRSANSLLGLPYDGRAP